MKIKRKNRDKEKSSFQKEEKIGKMHEGYRRERIFVRSKNRDETKLIIIKENGKENLLI